MNYKVRFVDFPLHYHRLESEIDAAIKQVLCGGDYIMRQHLKDFENNFASFIGTDYAVGLNSGTDALHLSLLVAGVGPGDEVITVAHSFVATVAAIVHCGAKPVLVLDQADVDVVLMKVIGTAAAASADRTLVADSDYGTPGALVGWIQIEIQDDGNRITDADYWVPFYATPT